MWSGKDHYAYDYKMTMYNDVDKYLQLMWNVMIYIIHHFVFGCMGVILGIFYEVWHANTWTMCQLMTLQWLQNDYKSFYMDIDKPAPHLLTYLPLCLPTNPLTYLPTHLPTTYPPIHPLYIYLLCTYLPTHLFTYPLQHAHLPTYLLFPISYNLFTIYLIIL
jgi:hypothetical protein